MKGNEKFGKDVWKYACQG